MPLFVFVVGILIRGAAFVLARKLVALLTLRCGLVAACASACLVTLGGCGARTGLVTGDVESDASRPPDAMAEADARLDARPDASACGAPDPPQPLSLFAGGVQGFGNVVGSGCSFAMTWTEDQNPGFAIVARTAQVVAGTWTLSPRAVVSQAALSLATATIGWDGSAYMLLWTDSSGALFMRRIGTDGTLLGPVVRVLSPIAGPGSSVVWIDASPEDAAIRIVLAGLFNGTGLWFLKITTAGAIVLPPIEVGDVSVGLAHLPSGGNRLVSWSDPDSPSGPETLTVSAFDDFGHATEPPASVVTELNFQFNTPGSVAQVGGNTYVGTAEQSPDFSEHTRVYVLGATDTVPTEVSGIAGGDVAALAATDTGVLGVLFGSESYGDEMTGNLLLSLAAEDRATATIDLGPGQASSVGQYSLGAGSASFGVFWWGTTDLEFSVKTP
jgi:hypothetical protein